MVNSVALDSAGWRELEELGTVRHVLRLGDTSDHADDLYAARFGATIMTLDGSEPGTVRLTQASCPVRGATLAVLAALPRPEAVLVLAPTVAVCGNLFQTHSSIWAPHDSLLVSLALWLNGQLAESRLGPPRWLQNQVRRGHVPKRRERK